MNRLRLPNLMTICMIATLVLTALNFGTPASIGDPPQLVDANSPNFYLSTIALDTGTGLSHTIIDVLNGTGQPKMRPKISMGELASAVQKNSTTVMASGTSEKSNSKLHCGSESITLHEHRKGVQGNPDCRDMNLLSKLNFNECNSTV